jgi:hypothetical protein
MRSGRQQLRTSLVGGGVLAACLGLAAPSAAEVVFAESFHDEDSGTSLDYCGVDGFDVHFDFVLDGSVRVIARKPGTAPYFQAHIHTSTTFTNADGESVHDKTSYIEKDLRITEHPDGTATIVTLLTGPSTLYDDATGKAIARNPGQVRFEFVVDLNGTPEDPTDDVFVEDHGLVKGSTGRNDDFCEAALGVLL